MVDMDNRGETEFNMSIMTLGRINYSIYLCSEFRRNKDLNSWYFELMNLYVETSTEMKGVLTNVVNKYTDKKEAEPSKYAEEDEFKKVEDIIDMLEPLVGRWNNSPDNAHITYKLFKHLMALQMLLMSILKSSGLLMKMKEDIFETDTAWD
jgi:hypothetical protein